MLLLKPSMTEILEFPQRRNLTATSRFLLAVYKQEEEHELACQQKRKVESLRKTTTAESNIARKELDFIFSGPNKDEAEKHYRQGLDDIANGRKSQVNNTERNGQLREFTDFLATEIFGTDSVSHSDEYTPEALFYIHIERLTEVANLAYDTPRADAT